MHNRIQLNRWYQRYSFMETLSCSLILLDPMNRRKANCTRPQNSFGSPSPPNPRVLQICEQLGYEFRDRVYNPMIILWMFVTQVISAVKSCQKAVARLNAWRACKGLSKVSSDTTSYCKARCRLPEALFERLLSWTATRCGEATHETWLFCGRIVEVVDGWTVTMADTQENQEEYPQMASQVADFRSRA